MSSYIPLETVFSDDMTEAMYVAGDYTVGHARYVPELREAVILNLALKGMGWSKADFIQINYGLEVLERENIE